MKNKIPYILPLLLFIFLTDAVEVTHEDINPPLVSYLLAKVHRLEAKMMAKPNVRNTREVEKRSVDTNTSADDKKTKDCPQQVVTYIRWGNTTCPYGANTIYKGVAAGGRNDHEVSPSNLMCLPSNPMRYSNAPAGRTPAYAVEYRVGGSVNHADGRNLPCSLCEGIGRVNKIMIPSHYVAQMVGIKNTMVTSCLDIIVTREVACIIALMKIWNKCQAVGVLKAYIYCTWFGYLDHMYPLIVAMLCLALYAQSDY